MQTFINDIQVLLYQYIKNTAKYSHKQNMFSKDAINHK